MVLTALETEKCPPCYFKEDVGTHTSKCLKCGAVKRYPPISKLLKQPGGRSGLREPDDPYCVPRKTRNAKKKATTY